MSSLTLRNAKGTPLTNAEVDANFTNLLVALGGANTSPWEIPVPTGTGSPVLSASPTLTGTVNASVIQAVDFNTTSDISLKTDITSFINGAEIINKLNPVKFKWKDSDEHVYGLIAQEVMTVCSDLVSIDRNSNLMSIKYNQIISILIQTLQTQQHLVNSLISRIQKLENNK